MVPVDAELDALAMLEEVTGKEQVVFFALRLCYG
jgi:hypothetical protein